MDFNKARQLFFIAFVILTLIFLGVLINLNVSTKIIDIETQTQNNLSIINWLWFIIILI